MSPLANDEKIRQRAYEIWEREGKPLGREREHWAAAERELSGDGTQPAAKKAPAKRTRKTLKEDPDAENLGKPSKKSRGTAAIREAPRK